MFEVQVSKRRGDFDLQAAFKAPTPGVVALFGRSGCGKTTLVNLIAGLLAPDAGNIRLNGRTLVDTASRENVPVEQRRVGYLFQDARLFPHLSVLGNLRYGQKRAPSGPQQISFDEVVGLLGLAHLLERRTQQLSGGEKQRVALGRALLAQPHLLLLDEPLASIDTARREELLPYLESLRDRLAIPMVYVSHQFDEVLRLATHVVLLDAGRVVAQGELSDISLRPELHAIIGADSIGSVLDGRVVGQDAATGLTELQVGQGTLRIATAAAPGSRVRVQLLARDIILATLPPQGLSVRNAVQGTIVSIADDGHAADQVRVDIGGAIVLARVTRAATTELELRTGLPVWVLVKSVSLRGYASGPAR